MAEPREKVLGDSRGWSSVFAVCAFLGMAACNDSKGYSEPGPRPQIIDMTGPSVGKVLNAVAWDPDVSGGACPMTVAISFRLPAEQFVWKAYVRFQGDGSDDGIDRAYLLKAYTSGQGDAVDAKATVDAFVPPTILRRGALFTYSVRLVTGAGEESAPTSLPLSIQDPVK